MKEGGTWCGEQPSCLKVVVGVGCGARISRPSLCPPLFVSRLQPVRLAGEGHQGQLDQSSLASLALLLTQLQHSPPGLAMESFLGMGKEKRAYSLTLFRSSSQAPIF